MLARFFGQTNSATPILLALYALLLGGVHFYVHLPTSVLVETVNGSITLPAWAVWVITLVPMLLVYFGNQWLFYNKLHLVHQNAFLPAIVLPLWLLGIQLEGPLFAVHTLILFVIYHMWLGAYHGQNILSTSLNTGFILGIGSLVDPGYLWLLAFTLVVYVNFGRLTIRTLIIPFVGYFTIWIDVWALEYLLNDSTQFLDAFGNHFSRNPSLLVGENFRFMWVLALMLVPGITEFTVTFSRANVFKRQAFTLFVLLIALAAGMFFLRGFSSLQLAIILTPISVLFANYVQYLRKKWIKEILLLLILVAFTAFEFGWV